MPENLQLVIITGMSGAGKQSLFKALKTWAISVSTIYHSSLIPKFWELIKESEKLPRLR